MLWKSTSLGTLDKVLAVLDELRGKRWLCRGQGECYEKIVPSIDRDALAGLPRPDKLSLERQAINTFRSTARFFAGPGESVALHDDNVALMVLRHYGAPTRLVDWSRSPHVAAYFSASSSTKDGELWAFDEPLYERLGLQQWKKWPETTSDGSGDGDKFHPQITAFQSEEPPDWFICMFYEAYAGFPRQHAQDGAYSMTARFGRDHADAIATLLERDERFHRYVIVESVKPELLKFLRERHGIWRGALFPDSAGAADTARELFPKAAAH